MSVSVKLNPILVVSCLAAVILAAVVVVTNRAGKAEPDQGPQATAVRTPAKAVDIIESATPAQSAAAVSARLFTTSPVAVLMDNRGGAAQKIAIQSAESLGVPILVDDAAAVTEISRLEAKTVLTFGKTRAVTGAVPIPVDADGAAAKIATLDLATVSHRVDAIVVTRSVTANAAAVATAKIAGATVIEIPDADPRTSRSVAKQLRDRPDSPVIALGQPFARGFSYALDIVRHNVEQPTGGYLALPGKHYTAMYGHPGAPQLGVLGEQGVRASVKRVEQLAAKYRRVSKAEFVPTFEIIATVASAGAGKDKDYSTEASITALTPLVDAAEKAGVYVILDLQPGRTDFLTQAKRYRTLLERPHVGLALDPEWRLKPKQKHLRQIGSVHAVEINRTADWLAALTRKERLPQKLFVLHQFSLSMIKGRSQLDTNHAELATVIHVDGSGAQGAKQGTWDVLRQNAPPVAGWGWKNFIDEDEPMLTVPQTWRSVRPKPDLITYQ